MDQNEIRTLKTAILNEVEGEKYYKTAARNAQDPDAAQAFLYLAEDEIKHQQMLKTILQSTLEGSECSIEDLDMDEAVSPAIFKDPETGKNKYAQEISVFHIAILMEKASMDFYRQAARSTTLATAQKLYESLATWEGKHLEAMEKIYDSLSEDWFDQQNFSPA